MPVKQEYLDRAVAIARAHGATRLILFGSAVEAPETARDLDLAVEGVAGWDFFGLAAALEAAIPIPVDVIPVDQMNESYFTKRVRERSRVLFERNRATEKADAAQ